MRRNRLLDPTDVEAPGRRLAVFLFFGTCASVFVVRWLRWEPAGLDPWTRSWNAGLFTSTLMAVLLAHELGHVWVARAHGVRLSGPWFLPFPLAFGTLGAVIRMESRPRTRAGLLEMAAAGPLAGFVVVLLALGIRRWSGEGADPGPLGQPWVVLLAGRPVGTSDPIGFAAWLGCLLTALNLVPLGQLDGGHVLTAIVPRQARRLGRGVTVALLGLAWWWPGWALWAAAIHLLGGQRTLQPLHAEEELTWRSRMVGGLVVGVGGLCWTTVPFPGLSVP